MSTRADRRLLVMRRSVPSQAEGEYATLWSELSRVATSAGCHAWRFRSPSDERERLEFLEFEATADLRRNDEAARILERLDGEIGMSSVEEWLEDR